MADADALGGDGRGAGGPGGAPGRVMITLALLLAMAVTALEQTVVSTAMPTIIAGLRGFDIYPWVFSAYLLASTVTTPIFGKLADIYGRKRVLLFGLALFSVGSMASGASQSMGQLIAMRVLQGLGAGAVGPMVLTLLGDLYSLRERARVQGLFSGVWGLSALAGPALGGVLTDRLSWRWVFYVTVPFSVVAAVILVAYVRESIRREKAVAIDWMGSLLMILGSSLLLMAVLQGPTWPRAATLTALAASLGLLAAFGWWERDRAVDPVLPVDLVLHPPIAAAIGGSFLIGALLFGLDTYVPLYVQGVLGGSAEDAGFAITPLFVSWSISVAVAAAVVVRFGFRATALVGSSLIATGMLALAAGAQRPEQSRALFFGGMIIIGLGMGPASLSYILGVQNLVAWDRRGVATGAVTFFRTIGGALGVGLLGAALGWDLAGRLATSGAAGVDVTRALRPETHALLGPEPLALVQAALGRSLRDVFLLMFALSALAIACSSRLVAGRAPDRPAAPDQASADVSLAMLE